MFLKLLLLSCIVITNAETNIDLLTENTCELVDTWRQNGYINTSAKYVVDEKEETIYLSYNCKERLGTVMANCLAGPGGFCKEISLLWGSPATASPGREEAVKRAQFNKPENGCSCARAGPSPNPESSSTADPSTRSISSIAPKSRDSSELRLAPSTSNSRLASSTTLPWSHTSGNDAVCIIKLADLDSVPRGKCYCSDNMSMDWQPGICEICS